MNTKPNPNIETRISSRAQSIFASLGTIVNDFYLEAGIYFVGGFNASLVAWGIYTDLMAGKQPLGYAITIAIVAFIAVEGLAVYLVGAAARTNSRLLWVFSIVFACFFTFAHYRQMTGQGDISEYITLAIPFFVVVGYWARTIKIDVETANAQAAQERDDELVDHNNEIARQHQIEDGERQRQREIEGQELAHKLEMDRLKLEQEQVQKLAQIEVQKSGQTNQMNRFLNQMNRQNDTFEPANGVRKNKKVDRQNDLVDLVKNGSNLGPTELAKRLNEIGHSVSISTVKRDIKALNGKMEAK